DTLQRHYDDHGDDFGSESPEHFAEQANDFYQRFLDEKLPAVEGVDGTIRAYEPDSNTVGSYRSDGNTRTFFKPPEGRAYFQRQIDRDLGEGGRMINPLPEEEAVPEVSPEIPDFLDVLPLIE